MKKQSISNFQDDPNAQVLTPAQANALKGGVYTLQPGDVILEVLDRETNYCRIQIQTQTGIVIIEDIVQ